MRTPNYELEAHVMSLINDGLKYKEIAKLKNISERYVYKIFKKYQPIKNIDNSNKKNNVLLTDVLNLHLIYNCNDFMLLNTMFKENLKKYTNKKIKIPNRIKKIGLEEKIKKILNFSI